MSVLSDFEDWRENPEFVSTGPDYSDYTGFYVGITICTLFGLSIILLNVVLCCCSPYRQYWRDPNTGNRIIFPVFIHSPHNQPPLTLQPELSQILIAEK
ncbi:Virion egress protein UL34 [Orchesella cincta]|uniref:Virion egress protein UL34 n=1 Tax=Orchesella cincta TaxID=48709 RepID=A0A1D2MJN2_ORCCI|nr:Virion egress protein UL34 [Orchesella cincta]